MSFKCLVRNLLKVPREEILNIKSNVKIIYEDNVEVDYNYKELIVLRYLLSVFTNYGNIPITSKYDFKNYYEEVKSASGFFKFYSKSTFRKWYGVFYNDISTYYVDNNTTNRSIFIDVGYAIWKNISDIYDDIVCSNLNYSDTIDIESFVELQNNSKLLEALEKCVSLKTTDSIANAYQVLDDVIKNDPTLEHNMVAKGYRVGSLKAGSVRHLVGPIGNISEVTSIIYSRPITSSYVIGMNDEYEAMLETRKAATANMESTETIRSSEYFARELQLATMFLESIVDTDCGTTEYLEWYIDPTDKKFFTTLIGKYYLNPNTNKIDYIKPTDTHLIGTTVQLRSLLFCKLKNTKHVCSKCFGRLANNININSNLGHFSSVELTEQISQGVLSTKHLITSANSNKIAIIDDSKGWLYVMDDAFNNDEKKLKEYLNRDKASKYMTGEIYVKSIGKSEIKDLKSLLLVIENNNKTQLANLMNIDLNTTDVNKLSDIYNFTLRFKYIDLKKDNKIEINNYAKYKSTFKLTKDFLRYMQNNMDNITINNNEIRIDILPYISTTQSKVCSIFKYTPTEFRYGILIAEIRNLFRIGDKYTKGKPAEFLRDVYTNINRKLSINIGILEAIVANYVTQDSLDIADYRMSRANDTSYVTITQNVIRSRTVGTSYGWDNMQHKVLTSPVSYLPTGKTSSAMDVLFTPNEILNKK